MGNKESETARNVRHQGCLPKFVIQENRAHIYDVSHNTVH